MTIDLNNKDIAAIIAMMKMLKYGIVEDCFSIDADLAGAIASLSEKILKGIKDAD